MGDMGDYWRDHREYVKGQKEKKESHAGNCLQQLVDAGYDLTELSDTHVRILSAAKPYEVRRVLGDYWPTTGTWILASGKRGRNIKGLLAALNTPQQEETK